jgi:hypothetical protein
VRPESCDDGLFRLRADGEQVECVWCHGECVDCRFDAIEYEFS